MCPKAGPVTFTVENKITEKLHFLAAAGYVGQKQGVPLFPGIIISFPFTLKGVLLK